MHVLVDLPHERLMDLLKHFPALQLLDLHYFLLDLALLSKHGLEVVLHQLELVDHQLGFVLLGEDVLDVLCVGFAFVDFALEGLEHWLEFF